MARSTSNLLINVNDLLRLQGVEKQRVEFKEAWHGKREGGTYWQVVHTISAYANDFFNDNGGYIIIGVDEKDKKESWEDSDDRQINYPPLGVPARELDRIQKEINGACRAQIKPEYRPIISPEVIECSEGITKHVLVIWAMASDNKPHTCRESEKGRDLYYVRQGTETKKATPEQIEELLRQGNKIPFDDRRAIDYGCGKRLSEDDIDFSLVQKFLKEIQSKLQEHADEKEPAYFYDKLKLLRYVGDKRIGDQLYKVWVPRNVALLLFNPSPHEFFRGAKTEIAIYTHDNETEEKCITGPIDQQIREVLSFILKTTKEEACHEFVAYPERALREAVVNAFHHRGYEDYNCDPIKIHIKPEYIDVISYPGPSPTLTKEHFKEGGEVPCVPSRNRRIAEFLKEKKLAEARFTGVKTIFKSMKQNRNPKPAFDFTSEQFRVRLPGHPKYIAYSVIRKVDNLCAKGDKQDAVNILKDFLDENLSTCPDMIIRKLLELFDNDQTHPDVQPYQKFISEKLQRTSPLITELCKWCVSEEMPDISIGVEIVNKLAKEGATSDDLDSVIRKAADLCQRRSDNREQVLEAAQNAHKLFEAMGADITQTNAFAAFQFACCKFTLYVKKCRSERQRKNLICYLKEAEDYVHKAKQLTREEYKHHLANQYRQLGYIHSQLFLIQKSTVERIKNFYDKARHYNSEIRISNIFIPAELRSFYMPLGSPTREINRFDPIE